MTKEEARQLLDDYLHDLYGQYGAKLPIYDVVIAQKFDGNTLEDISFRYALKIAYDL